MEFKPADRRDAQIVCAVRAGFMNGDEIALRLNLIRLQKKAAAVPEKRRRSQKLYPEIAARRAIRQIGRRLEQHGQISARRETTAAEIVRNDPGQGRARRRAFQRRDRIAIVSFFEKPAHHETVLSSGASRNPSPAFSMTPFDLSRDM